MTLSFVERMKEVLRRPVPYEGLLGRHQSTYRERSNMSRTAQNEREEAASRALEQREIEEARARTA